MTKLTNLFGENRLQLLLPDDLQGNVSEPMPTVTGNLTGSQTFTVFGQALDVDANLKGSVGISAVGAQNTSSTGVAYLPLAGQAFTAMAIQGDSSISGSKSVAPSTALSLSFSGSASAKMSYWHIRSEIPDQTKLAALLKLVSTSRLPMLMSPKDLQDGELQQISLDLELNLNAAASYGYSQDFQTNLFGNSAVPFSASVDAAIKLSLGLALIGKFYFTLEKITPLSSPDEVQKKWVRAQLSSQHKNTFSLAAKLDLEATYDLGTGLVGLLDEVLETQSVKTLFAQMNSISDILGSFQDGSLEEKLKSRLSNDLTQTLQLYLDQPLDKALSVLDQPEIQALLIKTNTLLTAYNNLGSKLQDLFNRVLTDANLEKGSAIYQDLTKLSELDAQNPSETISSYLSEEGTHVVTLLEVLAGQSLENLLLSQTATLTEILTHVKDLATKAVHLIDSGSDDVFSKLKSFAEKTGIQATVDWLNANLPSDGSVAQLEADLKAKANTYIQTGVEKLVGRAWASVDNVYLQELKVVAGKIKSYLDAGQNEVDQVKAQLQKLKGQVGFSLGFEWQRVTQRSAVVDISFDPTKQSNLDAFALLAKGDLKAFLKALPNNDSGPEIFMLNDCLLARSSLQTSAFSFWLSLFGSQETSSVLRQSESVRISQSADKAWVRQGSYLGQFSRTLGAGEDLWEASVGATLEGIANDTNLENPYLTTELGLMLSTVRNDTGTSTSDLSSTMDMLNTLGFSDVYNKLSTVDLTKPLPTRLAVNLSLDVAALKALVCITDLNTWKLAYLNAGYHWFNTLLTTRLGGSLVGPYLAQYIIGNVYPKIWWNNNISSENNALRDGFQKTKISLPNQSNQINGQLKTISIWPGLVDMPGYCAKTTDQYPKAYNALVKAEGTLLPNDCWDGLGQFAKVLKETAAKSWPSPMFSLYSVLCALQLLAKENPVNARGMCSFRTKVNGEWQAPISLWYANGLRMPLPISSL